MESIKTKVIFRGLAIAAFTLFGTTAIAQDDRAKKEPPTYAKLLEKMDTNKDGKLAKAEVKGPLSENFSEIDSNNDGYISEAEFKNAPRTEKKGPKK